MKKGLVRFGKVVIDFDGMEFWRSGRPIHLTYLEFELLEFFLSHPQCVFSREELIRKVWPRHTQTTGRTVDNCILHLRRKLEDNPSDPAYLVTVHRAGYKFALTQDALSVTDSRYSGD